MRYHIAASGQMGVVGLKRDTIAGALKKARELRGEGIYSDVRIVDSDTGAEVDEAQSGDARSPAGDRTPDVPGQG
ncbi:hypothetical protein [Arenibaculum pallidiluteum]|uniref:hypothetical protein n=1 Tax=Arenibaculum pallidiluteum TaxID=2812559 RepID=UPI001A97C470|nr:hypothetical protein [Arenibaculum pallidiluteum]